MLQIIVKANENFSAPELAQMAIEGGAMWVEYIPGGAGDDDMRETLSALAAVCRECGVMLTVAGHTRAAREARLHGVLMPTAIDAVGAREELGPEAIIGAVIESGAEVPRLEAADIDYAACPWGASPARMAEICSEARGKGAKMPIVARGDYSIAQLKDLLAAGANGLAISEAVTAATDPVAATREALEAIKAL